TAWDEKVIVRSHERVGRLVEHDRFGGNGLSGFGRVVAVVEAYTEDLMGPRERCTDSAVPEWFGFAGSAPFGDDAGQRCDLASGEEGFVVVADDVGQVHEHVTFDQCSGALGSSFAGSDKSHVPVSLSLWRSDLLWHSFTSIFRIATCYSDKWKLSKNGRSPKCSLVLRAGPKLLHSPRLD